MCFSQVFSEYFKELEEESIRDNFVIIYELLDELMDLDTRKPLTARSFRSESMFHFLLRSVFNSSVHSPSNQTTDIHIKVFKSLHCCVSNDAALKYFQALLWPSRCHSGVTDGKVFIFTDTSRRKVTSWTRALRGPLPQSPTAVSWRSEGIKYRKNEVFLDVIESVNLLVCF